MWGDLGESHDELLFALLTSRRSSHKSRPRLRTTAQVQVADTTQSPRGSPPRQHDAARGGPMVHRLSAGGPEGGGFEIACSHTRHSCSGRRLAGVEEIGVRLHLEDPTCRIRGIAMPQRHPRGFDDRPFLISRLHNIGSSAFASGRADAPNRRASMPPGSHAYISAGLRYREGPSSRSSSGSRLAPRSA